MTHRLIVQVFRSIRQKKLYSITTTLSGAVEIQDELLELLLSLGYQSPHSKLMKGAAKRLFYKYAIKYIEIFP